MQVTHAGIAEVGDEAFKPSDWRGCIKAGELPPSPCLLSAGLLRIGRSSVVTRMSVYLSRTGTGPVD